MTLPLSFCTSYSLAPIILSLSRVLLHYFGGITCFDWSKLSKLQNAALSFSPQQNCFWPITLYRFFNFMETLDIPLVMACIYPMKSSRSLELVGHLSGIVLDKVRLLLLKTPLRNYTSLWNSRHRCGFSFSSCSWNLVNISAIHCR